MGGLHLHLQLLRHPIELSLILQYSAYVKVLVGALKTDARSCFVQTELRSLRFQIHITVSQIVFNFIDIRRGNHDLEIMRAANTYVNASESMQCLDKRIIVILTSLAGWSNYTHEQVLVRFFGRQTLEFVRSEISQRANYEPCNTTSLLNIVLSRCKNRENKNKSQSNHVLSV